MTHLILFVFPPITAIWVAAGALLVGGTAAAAAGVHRINGLKKRYKHRYKKYCKYEKWFFSEVKKFNTLLQEFGEMKVRYYTRQKNWVDFLFDVDLPLHHGFVDKKGVAFHVGETLQRSRLHSIEALSLVKTAAHGAGIGAAAAGSIYTFIAAFGTASTGTAISSLSGAAAKSAILASLGGGSLAAGGFGIVGGLIAGAGIVLAPSALFMGLHLQEHAEKLYTDIKKAERIMERNRAKYKETLKVLYSTAKVINEYKKDLRRLRAVIEPEIQRLQELKSRGVAINNPSSQEEKERLASLVLHLKALDELLQVPLFENGLCTPKHRGNML
jgi:hypothetical protein